MWLKIQPERGLLKITWGGDFGPHTYYYIGEEMVEQAAERTQRALSRMADAGRDDAPVPFTLLSDIAAAGAGLWFVLFDRPNDSEGVALPGDRIATLKAWIRGKHESGDRTLSINTVPSLHIPWGIVYEGDPDSPPQGREQEPTKSLEEFSEFWCLKYDLFVGLTSAEIAINRQAKPRDSFRMLSVIHEAAFATATGRLAEPDARELKRLIDMPEGKAVDLPAARQKARETASRDILLHFFGHHYDGTLDLGNGNTLDSLELRRLLSRLTESDGGDRSRPLRLIFINACSGLLGQGHYNLRAASSEPGFCGLISTEADVPEGFAVRYGLSLLSAIASEGLSVGEAMRRLRVNPAFWPLSLLYGCYAHPHFRIAPEN